jgi:excisionase family DNA binding protein
MPIRLGRLKSKETVAAVTPNASIPSVSAAAGPDPAEMGAGPPAPPFLSLREAAGWLSISVTTLNRLIARGDLATVRVGKLRKVPASYLTAYVGTDILLPGQVAEIAPAGCWSTHRPWGGVSNPLTRKIRLPALDQRVTQRESAEQDGVATLSFDDWRLRSHQRLQEQDF